MSALRDAIRKRLDFVPSEQRNRNFAIGAIVLGVAVFALVSAVTHHVPLISTESGRVVRAEFAAANQVTTRTPVRVGGVDVGEVDEVRPGRTPDTALVTMRIEDDTVVPKRDARADIRWRTILGGTVYVDLQPGSQSAADLGDETIPAERTSSQVELDDIARVFRPGTADAQRLMLRELRAGFADPRATGRSIDVLGPGLATVAQGMEPLRGREDGDLRKLVASTARAVSALGRDAGDLEALVAGADRTLAVTDARRRELGELLELSPGALDSTEVTMRRLRTTLDHLDPLVQRLRPGARALAPAAAIATPALVQARGLLREVRPLLVAAKPTLDALRRVSANGTPLVQGLDPTIRRLDSELLPFLARRDDSTRLRNYEAIGPFFSAVGGSAMEFNDLGHIIQFPVLGGPNSALAGHTGTTALMKRCSSSVGASQRSRCAGAVTIVKALLGGRR